MSDEYSGEYGEYEEDNEEYSTYESKSSLESRACILTYSEACKCLHTLGKCDTGTKYAYLFLDASNKLLTDVSVIPMFKYVIYVNVSGNKLTSDAIQVISRMTYLLMLQADRNELTSAVLDPMPYLQVLTLNNNNLMDTSGISHKLLERLELSYNNITDVTLNSSVLENLKILTLRANRLTTTNGIFCPGLTHLYMADNRIDKIEGLHTLANLTTLHLRTNKLSDLDGFDPRCAKLNYLNLRNNDIARISELKKLNCLPILETLIISENRIAEQKDDEEEAMNYRCIVLAMLPNLKRIDKDPVLEEEQQEAAEIRNRLIKEGSSFKDFDTNATENE